MSEQSESEKSESKKSPDAADVSEMNKSTAAAEQQQQQSTTTTNDMTVSSATKAEPSSEQQPQQSMVEKSKSITENIPVDESQQQQQPIDGQISQKSIESEKDEPEDQDQKSMAADLDASPSKTSAEQRSTTGTSSRGPIMRRRRKGEKVTEKNVRIGFIGAGKMTEVIVKGLLEVTPADGSERINPKQIFVSSKSGKTHDHFKRLGCYVTKRSYDIFGRMDCDMIFMAVHGFVIRQCYKSGGIRPLALTTNFIPNQRHPLYILSLIGGISLNDIKRTLLNPDHPEKYRVEMHRIMLNPSVAYGLGIGGIDVEPDSKQCSGLIRNILCRICRLETINESHMDIACAAGGYGSTFCYYFMAAIADGAFKRGLPKNLATKIAARTLQSAAASILESGKNPNDLRDSCASPSGPAIYGLHVLDKADCASGFAAAVEAAYQRIKELSENPPT